MTFYFLQKYMDAINAVRYNMDGDGSVTGTNSTNYSNAFPDAMSGMGCGGSGCVGYELEVSLDFDDSAWSTGNGWTPLGTKSDSLIAIFQGNGKVLSNLRINVTADNNNDDGTGFLGSIGVGGSLKNLGMENVSIRHDGGGQQIGGLTGWNHGDIENCYVTGSVGARDGGNIRIGGLVGRNHGFIKTSYSMAPISGGTRAGGLIGRQGEDRAGNRISGFIACYATGSVTPGGANQGGGAVGDISTPNVLMKISYVTGEVQDPNGSGQRAGWSTSFSTRQSHINDGDADVHKNYFDQNTTRATSNRPTTWWSDSNHPLARNHLQGRSTSGLKSPTDYTGIYSTWDDFDLNGDTQADAPWDFGSNSQYPALKVDFNGDGTATVEEFGPQRPATEVSP